MTQPVQLILDASTATLNAGLNGALQGVSTSLSAIAAVFGEEFEEDLNYQIQQIIAELDFDLKTIEISAIELKTNIDINFANISLEIENIFDNISVPGLKSFDTPTISFMRDLGVPDITIKTSLFTLKIPSFALLILGFFILLSALVTYDTFNIKNQRDEYISFKGGSIRSPL